MDRAKAFFDKRLKDPQAAAAALGRLRMDVSGDGVADADVVIEAIFENVEAKQALYAELEPKLKPTAVLATNTSSIRIETLAQKLRDPSRLVGIHFFNPVAQLQLVEIVQGAGTQAAGGAERSEVHPQARQAAAALQERARVRRQPHFDARMSTRPCSRWKAASRPRVIDRAGKEFGMPMGPIELTDVVGLDVSLHVGRVLARGVSAATCPQILIKLVEQKKLGRKSGEGFYRLARRQAGASTESPQFAMPADLEDRLILPMLNEAVACLREGVVEDADLLDAGAIFATGFAPFRGGPLQYAKARGVPNVIARLTELAQRYGERFRPDPGWQPISA